MKYFQLILYLSSLGFAQTNEQIQQAKTMIQNTGMSESQARSLAKSKGFSDKQIDDAINKEISKQQINKNDNDITPILNPIDFEVSNNQIDNSLSNNINDKSLTNNSPQDLGIVSDGEIKIAEDQSIMEKVLAEQESQLVTYFGYDIFNRDPSLFQSSSAGAVDPKYLIGPGDEIIVMLWGETQFRQVLSVDKEGFIFIPEIGQVFVNGLNLNLLESKLFRVLSQSYSSLNPQGGKATTFLDVSLGNLRPLRIQVLGEVSQPGAYTVNPAASLFSSLYYFNGPTALGSLRDIRLIRDGKQISSIDFYDFLLTGKKPRDEKLQLDDVVFIPNRLKTVTIKGEVNRPGIYELKPSETLKDLIFISGGIKVSAYLERAQIDRILPFEKRNELGMDRMFIDVNISEVLQGDSIFSIQDGDNIEIFSILDARSNVVSISGAITRPGTYDIGSGLKLSELISKADSLLGDAYMERLDVIRIKPDYNKELLKLNLKKVLEGDVENDIKLSSLDQIRIYSTSEMFPDNYVSIIGFVKFPGKYQLMENMTLFDLLFKAGGFLDEEFKKLAYMDRAELIRTVGGPNDKKIIPFSLEEVLDKKDMASELLNPDDLIRIYSKSQIKGGVRYVSISGYVKTPGRYELYQKNMTLYDLIFRAGGMNDPMHLNNAFLERADLIRYEKDRINQKIIPFNLNEIILNQDSPENYILKPGDHVKIYSKNVFNDQRTCMINGIVRNPGTLVYKKKMTLKDAIIEAGGVLNDYYKYRIEVARIDPSITDENLFAKSFIISLNNDYSIDWVNNLSVTDSSVSEKLFFLKPYDKISVFPDPLFSMQKTVSVEGAVYYPGEYSILNAQETVYDLIQRAGGLRPKAFLSGSSFTRNGENIKINLKNIMKRPRSKHNLVVQDGDKVFIDKNPDMIKILGEVNSPGNYKFIKGLKVSNAISLAGGYSQNAEKNNVFIIYPDGTSIKCFSWYRNPKVIDGSQIIIGVKEPEEPFDKTEYAKEITSIIANIAQAVSLLMIARAS